MKLWSLITIVATIVTIITAQMDSFQLTETPRYSRIHIKDHREFPLVYRLLETYITKPEEALSIKDIVFDPRWLPVWYYYVPEPGTDELRDIEAVRDVSDEKVFHRAVKRLGLSPDDEEGWVRTLTWMKPELVAQRQPADAKEYVAQFGDKFGQKQDLDFAYCATALLLTLCPNVERLVYRDNSDRQFNPVKNILRKINYGKLPDQHLQKLKSVVLLPTHSSWGEGEQYESMDVVALLRMFHRLTSMESLSVEGIDPRGEHLDVFPPATSNIKRISVTQAMLSSKVIAALVCAPKALEELTITNGGRESWDGSFANIKIREVGKAVLSQKDSLVKLDLDLGCSGLFADSHPSSSHSYDSEDEDDVYHLPGIGFDADESAERIIDNAETYRPWRVTNLPDDRAYGGTLGSLHDFRKLTHLCISISMFHNASLQLINLLPPNLKYLVIRGYNEEAQSEFGGQIADVVKLKTILFPELTEIHGIDKFFPEGTGNPCWKIEHADYGWLEHRHDEL